jgi:predicted SprT family Zn-dependent metalloprotease
MDKEIMTPDPAQIAVADRVTFSYHGRAVTGSVAKKGRTHAHIVGEDRQEFRVPYQQLTKISGGVPHPVQTVNDSRRAQFHPGDRVRFPFRGTVVHGVVARLNPTRSYVVGAEGKEYRVPYALLQRLAGAPPPIGSPRSDTALGAVARLARELLARYQLSHWRFQFDAATKRAGCCQYAPQVISLSYEFARRATDEEIRETLLHEIAHALVGKQHHHDTLWRATAREIGCSGRRCHELQFTPPRYIVQCAQGCWIATAERRQHGVVCNRCRGQVVYLTYTEERWNSERAKAAK